MDEDLSIYYSKDEIAENTIELLQSANAELRSIMEETFWLADGGKSITENYFALQPRMICFAALLDMITEKLSFCYNLASEGQKAELRVLLKAD